MNLRLAKENDLILIMEMISIVKKHMIENGNDQWDGAYPDQDTLKKDIIDENLYTIIEENNCMAIIVINKFQAPEYESIHWKLNDNSPLVVHRLAVNPKFQGKGIAKTIMSFVDEKARKLNCKSIRLDTYSKNKVAINLYKKLGYSIVGEVYFRGKENPFKCFEKII
ncbi:MULTISPECIES: GNAT family N-acetyltransferase [Clostridium]|uniref:GNAT family N-acetyltransferase n=1 Tax=Clostridium sporogenes TaxID=1509 RepID=A0AAE4FHL6_CLOSG|nr:GNAT family N-acetyltransferase [Clostridium sporogenes]MDS1002474.1 GNAT family N-acetyltransferase [Clostridium sporogenes]